MKPDLAIYCLVFWSMQLLCQRMEIEELEFIGYPH